MRKIKEIEAEKTQNWARIGTVLVKEAAKCENFASDILIDCNKIVNVVAEEKEFSEDFYLGFRENGVDHKEFVKGRLGENLTDNYIEDIYFVLYRLNVTKERAYGSYSVTYTLYRIVNEE